MLLNEIGKRKNKPIAEIFDLMQEDGVWLNGQGLY
jgi:hypothetical protein